MTSQEKLSFERLSDITKTTDPLVLARDFARRITIGPRIALILVGNMSQNFELPEGQSVLDVLVSQLLTVLVQPARLEFRCTEGRNESEFIVYPFGMDQPLLSFALQAMASDWVAKAEVLRFIIQGRGNDLGGVLMSDANVSPDRTRITYRQFAYNSVFSQSLCRTAVVAFYLSVYAAESFQKHSERCSGEPTLDNPVEHARLLMVDCLNEVAVRLADMWDKPEVRRSHPALTMMTRKHVHALVDICSSPTTFHSKEFSDVFVQFAKDHFEERRSAAGGGGL